MRPRRLASAPLLAAALWLVLAVLIALTGQRFSTDYLSFGWQLVPYDNLRADPFGSVWHLHIQPPVWNLVLGSVGRWSPGSDALSLQLLMLAIGALAACLLCDALRCFGVRNRVAVAVAVAAMAIPDVIFNAFGATYELAVSLLLIAIVWAVARGRATAASSRSRWFLVLVVAATALTMTRTVYHPLWLVALLAYIGWRWRTWLSRRTLLLAAAIPTVIVGGWMVKNEVIVDRFTLSTWSGMNLQRATIPVLDLDEKAAMVAAGELSQVAAAGPFRSYDSYEPSVGPCVLRSGDPAVLTRLDRGGEVYVPNFNARCYLPVYDLAGDDALTVIRQHPTVYLEGRAWAVRTWFALYEAPGRSPSGLLRALHGIYDIGLVGAHGTLSTRDWGTPIFGPMAVLTHFSLVLLACTVACLTLAARRRWRDRDVEVVVAYLVAWTFATGVLFELGEQARFRTMTDPLVLAFGAIAIGRAVVALVNRRRVGAPAVSPTPAS